MADRDFITHEEAARILNKSVRSVYRYARQKRIRTRDTPGGKVFSRDDVQELARQFGATPRPNPAELVPVSDMLSALQRKDADLAEANERLQRAALEIGRLQGQLDAAHERIRMLEAPKEPQREETQPEPEQPRGGWRQWLRRRLQR